MTTFYNSESLFTFKVEREVKENDGYYITIYYCGKPVEITWFPNELLLRSTQ